MAKGKTSKGTGKVSAGIHSNLDKRMVNAIRAEYMSSADRLINQLAAHKAGKKVMVTMPNPNKEQTNKKFVRVLSTTIWRDPKHSSF